jgi:hypothetical protein
MGVYCWTGGHPGWGTGLAAPVLCLFRRGAGANLYLSELFANI